MAETNHDTAPAAEAVELDAFTAGLADQGFAIDGGYPANLRLRAEALAHAGKTEDPVGQVTPEAIAETADRLAAEKREADARAEAEAKTTPSLRWTRDDLAAEATRRGLVLESDATKATLLDAINAAPAPANEG